MAAVDVHYSRESDGPFEGFNDFTRGWPIFSLLRLFALYK